MKKKFFPALFFFLISINYAHAQTAIFSGAAWISTGYQEDSIERPCPVFVKDLRLPKVVRSATLYITALGLYEAQINGRKTGDAFFTPGYTSYDKRLQYQQYDVAPLLQRGGNEIRITVADGWYRGIFGGDMTNNKYGRDAGLLCRMNIVYTDGTADSLVSDDSWRCGTGMRRHADFYQGEVQDSRMELVKDPRPVRLLSPPKAKLVAQQGPSVTRHEMFSPQRIWQSAKGEKLADFGQNMAGWVRIRLQGHAGDTVKIFYAEMLDTAGNFYTANLREAKAVDIYVLNGSQQVLEPRFAYHGFRYIKIEGVDPGKVVCKAFAAYTDIRPNGSFSCSDPLINRLQLNIGWSLKSNFMDIPTDCPQRSERLGWTGDAQVFCRTAAFHADVRDFFAKWLQDLAADQGVNGGVPNIIPDTYRHRQDNKGGVAGWGDAATMIPWALYEVYGDTAILRDQYSSMKAWVDYIGGKTFNDLWLDGGYGDWYAPGDSTSIPYIDQCFYVHSLDILTRTARVLGRAEDAETYGRVSLRVRKAFLRAYIMTSSPPQNSSTQTACVLALAFDLLPDSLRSGMAERLVERIAQNKGFLATGFLGTPYLLPVLTRYGHTDVAYRLLLQQGCPSWLYPVTKGATTIWERWDAIRPDGSMQQTSYNHYSYGAVGQWLYETVAGIQPAAPGYDTVRIAPQPGGGLEWVKGAYTCKYGRIRAEWRRKGKHVVYHITIPAGAVAVIALPGQPEKRVGGGDFHYRVRQAN